MTVTASYLAKNPQIISTGGASIEDRIQLIPEADSQTFKAGQLVYIDTTNWRINACADDAVVIYGIALEDGANDTNNANIAVCPIYPTDIVRMRVWNSGAETTTTNCSHTQLIGVEVDSNICYAELDNVTNDALFFVAAEKNAKGAHNVWGHFKFISSVLQDADGSNAA